MAYGTPAELARILQLSAPSAAQQLALQRVLDATATEIDNELALTEPLTAPYPPLVIEVIVERAVEHWKQEQSPFGLVVLGGDSAARVRVPEQLAASRPDAAAVEGRQLGWCG